jgi:hypothetical protein
MEKANRRDIAAAADLTDLIIFTRSRMMRAPCAHNDRR